MSNCLHGLDELAVIIVDQRFSLPVEPLDLGDELVLQSEKVEQVRGVKGGGYIGVGVKTRRVEFGRWCCRGGRGGRLVLVLGEDWRERGD
jgi:hypothetical protein